MTEKFIKNLKELRKIAPNPDYSRHSRALILYGEKTKNEAAKGSWLANAVNIFYESKFKVATGMALVIVLTLLGGIYYVNRINKDDLVVRASELNSSIQVNLDSMKYILQNQPNINPLLVPNMQKMLQEANDDLKQAAELSKTPEKMKDALAKIKSAQEIFQQINSFFK